MLTDKAASGVAAPSALVTVTFPAPFVVKFRATAPFTAPERVMLPLFVVARVVGPVNVSAPE